MFGVVGVFDVSPVVLPAALVAAAAMIIWKVRSSPGAKKTTEASKSHLKQVDNEVR